MYINNLVRGVVLTGSVVVSLVLATLYHGERKHNLEMGKYVREQTEIQIIGICEAEKGLYELHNPRKNYTSEDFKSCIESERLRGP
ncbi:MAG: hypothetical protein IIA85_02570 [Nanoarchaeota archaeon]|nr:hypothetical protein [Nanoarchaeota archaeon]